MPYPAASVANGFLQRSFSDGNLITPMKIQKLVYIAHGCTLVECEAPLLGIHLIGETWTRLVADVVTGKR